MGFLIRLIGYLFGLGVVLAFIAAGTAWALFRYINRDLPDIAGLRQYEPPVMTRVHATDGNLVAEYAGEEPRLFLPIRAIPALVKNAFISAEDKNFYDHPGIDPEGVARAILNNIQDVARGGRRRPEGASTITQQVAKNFLLSPEATLERKAKEAILALRIERALTKDQILELYLNEIYLGSLGRQAYGIAAASLLYFDKSVHELTVAEAAYLAALPKGPTNYHPFRYPERAVGRRNDIIDLMMRNGYVSREQGEKAKTEPLVVTPRQTGPHLFASDYFAEEVRRELISIYGDKALGAGLSVRSTLDPRLQALARRALMNGLIRFDEDLGYRGPVAKIDTVSGDWGPKLAEIKALSDVPEWRLAVVLAVSDQEAQIGFQPPRLLTGQISSERERGVVTLEGVRWAKAAEGARRGVPVRTVSQVLNVGDVVYVEKQTIGDRTINRLRQNPEIGGAMVVMDPQTGRVLALAGGFSFAESQFNRATQAFRQPGSSFKPFIYAAALDNGYTPSSLILDGPIEISQGPGLPPWRPENYSGKFNGPTTLRAGIEQSRNTMTVRLAKDMGMPIVVEYAKRFGIYDNLAPFLSNSLGAGETTVLRLTTAYATIANGGRKVKATLIDRIQDRHGRTIFKHDQRQCARCQAVAWTGQAEPELVDEREQVLDPLTAYQITYIMEGVIQRGTAQVLKDLNRPIAGKTGTSNDEKDAWFIGFTPDLVAGVFVGYDRPRPMGKGRTGGVVAAPIFKEFMAEAMKGKPAVPFKVPEGIRYISIDRKTGLRASAGDSNAFQEAFKPGTGPPESFSVIGFDTADTSRPRRVTPEVERQLQPGGLY